MVIFAVWAVNETEFATGEAYDDFILVAFIAETLPILFKVGSIKSHRKNLQ